MTGDRGAAGASADSASAKAVETVWRIESPRLLGGLIRFVRDVDLAEDLAHEALLVALENWPRSGIPENPGAWLMTAAKHRAIDLARRRKLAEKHGDLAGAADFTSASEPETTGEDLGDDLLRLVFVACHPVLSAEARVALTLRLLAGLSTEEIARAFLLPEPTIAQRIVRAKRSLSEARVPFEVPSGKELGARLPSVLEVIYLIFNEGYSATKGDAWMRPELTQDALRLGRILAQLLRAEAEVHGLLSLMELQASRMRTRIDRSGTPILLLQQDRSRWDHLLIQRGLAALSRAETLAQPLGPYTLQAAIAASHARARTAAETDWARIALHYDALAALTQSPVVELNRAVAVGMAFGPAEGLAIVDELRHEPALAGYHLLPSVRGDLLEKLGRFGEAAREFQQAAALTKNTRERELLQGRAAACRSKTLG